MIDPIGASERAISRGLAVWLTPPAEAVEFCEVCRKEECRCPKCAVCGEANECRYVDCGEQQAPEDWNADARAEDLHLEEGRDADREPRE